MQFRYIVIILLATIFTSCTITRGNSIGYYAVLHNGGYWAYGLYGQVLYINPEKRLIGVFLGADRLNDFTLVFDAVCSGRATIM